MDTDGAQPLPGLEALTADRPVGYVESGVRRTLAALAAADRLAELDAGHLAVAVALSRIIAQKEARGRLSTVSNDARLLVELLDGFLDDGKESGGVDEQLRAVMDEWTKFADDVEQRERDQRQEQRTP